MTLTQTTHAPRIHALIPCAGTGLRMGFEKPKQYELLAGLPMVIHACQTLLRVRAIDSVHVGLAPDDQEVIDWPNSVKFHTHHLGGATRQETVLQTAQALLHAQLAQEQDWVLVHDAARPGLSQVLVEQLIRAVTADDQHIGGILALPLADTLKRAVTDQALIHETVSRDGLWLAQTPQMFRIGALCEALKQGIQAGAELTDEASAFERLGFKPLLVMGDIRNLKVTYPGDWVIMTQLLQTSERQA